MMERPDAAADTCRGRHHRSELRGDDRTNNALCRFGHNKTALVVAIAMTSALVLDYVFNWQSVRYLIGC